MTVSDLAPNAALAMFTNEQQSVLRMLRTWSLVPLGAPSVRQLAYSGCDARCVEELIEQGVVERVEPVVPGSPSGIALSELGLTLFQ